MDLVAKTESHNKEVGAGWADVKQLLLCCSVANSHRPQPYLSEAFRKGKPQSWESKRTGKQYWRNQNSFASGSLLVAMAGSSCAQRFQGGDSGSATFPSLCPAFPFWHCCAATFRQQMGPCWQHRVVSKAGVQARPLQVQGYVGNASATLPSTPPLSRLSCMLVPSSHICAAFFLLRVFALTGRCAQDAAMCRHFHSHHKAAWPRVCGGLQPGEERGAEPGPARGKPGAWHAAKLTAGGCSGRRRG